MIPLAQLLENQGRLDEAERWLCQATDADSHGAMISLAYLLEDQGRLDEAEEWLLVASYGDDGDSDIAMIRLAELLDRRGRSDEGWQWRKQAAELRVTLTQASAEWASIVITAIITTSVVPFVQTIVTKSAEDSYAAAKALLRRLLRQHSAGKH